jgi:uncharacterized protein
MEEKVFVENKKHLKLAAIINRPNDEDAHPAVILLHGFTGYKEEPHLVSLAHTLAKNGIVAIRFDFAGYGESEGTTEKDYRFTLHYHDVETIVEYLQSQSYVDKNKIGLYGHSLGGLMSIVFSSEHPEIKSVVCVSAPTMLHLSPWAKTIIEAWKLSGLFYFKNADYPGRNLPYEFMEDVMHYDALSYAPLVKQPTLVVFGDADDTIDASNTKAIYDALKGTKDVLEIQEMDHEYGSQPEVLKQVNKKILEFYLKHL